MTTHAHGTFAVQLTPQALAHAEADASLGRLAIDKQFQGDLVGTSQGEMLSARTAVESSAGYVAIERVTGALHGRQGSFVLQHSGTRIARPWLRRRLPQVARAALSSSIAAPWIAVSSSW